MSVSQTVTIVKQPCDLSAIWSLDIAPAQKIVLIALADSPDTNEGWTAAAIAARTGYCERRAKAILYQLAKDRRVTTQRQNGKATTYRSSVLTLESSCEKIAHPDSKWYANIAHREEITHARIAQQEETANARIAHPEPELSNAGAPVHDTQAREESLSLVLDPVDSDQKQEGDDGDDAGAREVGAEVSSSDDDGFNIFALYHDTFGKMVANAILADDLRDMAATFPSDWIREAFELAAKANATHQNYVWAVLRGWRDRGKGVKPALLKANARTPSQVKTDLKPAKPAQKPKRAEYPADMPDIATQMYFARLAAAGH